MQTQVKLNVTDELFEKAAQEILTAKITELARKAINDGKIEKIIGSCKLNLSSVMKDYFEWDYGEYRPTDQLKKELKYIFDDEIHKALTDIINKDNVSEFVKNAVEERVKEYISFWKNDIQKLLPDAIQKALKDEIGKLAKERFNEMFATSDNQ